VENSFETVAVIARALLRQPDGKVASLPSGQLSIRRVRGTTVRSGPLEAKIALYAIFGFDYSPTLLWLHDDTRALFAVVYPGFAVVEPGWEGRADDLLKIQQEGERELLTTLADSLTHRFSGPILIKSVRVFDSGSATMRGPSTFTFPRTYRFDRARGLTGARSCDIIDGEGRFLLPAPSTCTVTNGDGTRCYKLPAALRPSATWATTTRHWRSCERTLRRDHRGPRIVPAGFIEGELVRIQIRDRHQFGG
jgi:hypothetical protein